MLELELIRIDGETQTRVELDQDTVDAYAESYLAGAEFPPVTVFFDGKDRWLADGFHRYFAAKKAGKAAIFEHIVPGTKRDAVLFSLGANGKHGKPPSNADKRNAVERMLEDKEWSSWSQERIAKTCNVSIGLVSKMVHELASLHGEEIKPATRTVERNGKTYELNTANIGKAKPAESDSTEAEPAPKTVEPTPKAAPQDTPEDDGPSAEEIAAQHAAEAADRALVATLLESDAPLAALAEENKQLKAEIVQLKLARDGFMNRCNEAIALVKSRDRQIAKLEKMMKAEA